MCINKEQAGSVTWLGINRFKFHKNHKVKRGYMGHQVHHLFNTSLQIKALQTEGCLTSVKLHPLKRHPPPLYVIISTVEFLFLKSFFPPHNIKWDLLPSNLNPLFHVQYSGLKENKS